MKFNNFDKYLLLIIALIFSATSLFSQTRFFFKSPDDTKDKIQFELVQNLIIIPITINGVEFSFLLDTGVENTILFSLKEKDSLVFNDAVSIKIRGLGQGESLLAFRSENNQAKIGNAISQNLSLYVIFNNEINLSQFLGIPVHGIIGYDFFKNFIVEVNYTREFIKFYDPSTYDEKCRNCENEPLYFHNKKPYIKTNAVVSGEPVNFTLLVDSGASDALWLFPNERVKVPKNYFEDFLGRGISGSVFGKRSKINFFSIGGFEFENITTAFPDSLAFRNISDHLFKDGLVGSEILRRFDLVIDYPNKQLLLKPNRFFNDQFYYNMSGLVIRYSGVQVVKDFEYVNVGRFNQGINLDSESNFKRKLYDVKFSIVRQMEIVEVRTGSFAFEAGLRKGDVLISINGKKARHYTLAELSQLFSSEEGKKIRMKINRQGKEMKIKFILKKVL